MQTALIKRTIPAADYIFKPGSWVYAYREVSKMWTGPHLIADICGKATYVHLGERTVPRQFNVAQLKPSHNHQHMSPDQSIGSVPTSYSTRFTEMIPGNDARARLFDDAKRKEMLGFIDRGTFRLAVAEEIPETPNIIPLRYVLAIKSKEGNEVMEARFVLGGNRDRDRRQLLHGSTTLKQQSVRTLLTMPPYLGLMSWRQMSYKHICRVRLT
jgi:hypothetical protein